MATMSPGDVTLREYQRLHVVVTSAETAGSSSGNAWASAYDGESCDCLALQHPHARDARIQFFAEDHRYMLDGTVRFPLSVSGVWGSKFAGFDAQACVDKYYSGWESNAKPATNKYFKLILYLREAAGMEDEEIKKEILKYWEWNGIEKARLGTDMHRLIELHINGEPFPPSYGSKCELVTMSYFQSFYESCEEAGWKPYRTEWSIFCDESMVAGQIDAVFEDENGDFHMVSGGRARVWGWGAHSIPPAG